jgi:hypothetical protein
MYLYSLKPDLTVDFTTQLPAAAGDQFMGELSAAPNGRAWTRRTGIAATRGTRSST